MSNHLYGSSQALAKVVALSAMCHDFAEKLDFSYLQEFSASFSGISVDFKWEKEGDIKSLYFIINSERSNIPHAVFTHKIFDYNSAEDSVLYNNESLAVSLFEATKGYVTSDADSPEFSLQVVDNQRKYNMTILVSDYILSAGKNMAEKINN